MHTLTQLLIKIFTGVENSHFNIKINKNKNPQANLIKEQNNKKIRRLIIDIGSPKRKHNNSNFNARNLLISVSHKIKRWNLSLINLYIIIIMNIIIRRCSSRNEISKLIFPLKSTRISPLPISNRKKNLACVFFGRYIIYNIYFLRVIIILLISERNNLARVS